MPGSGIASGCRYSMTLAKARRGLPVRTTGLPLLRSMRRILAAIAAGAIIAVADEFRAVLSRRSCSMKEIVPGVALSRLATPVMICLASPTTWALSNFARSPTVAWRMGAMLGVAALGIAAGGAASV